MQPTGACGHRGLDIQLGQASMLISSARPLFSTALPQRFTRVSYRDLRISPATVLGIDVP